MTVPFCIHAIIAGRVQGVYYRAWTVSNAKERGLAGWVRNRTDGTVEAVFCGEAALVEDMLAACKEGPPAARVDHITRSSWDGEVPSGFTQTSTA